MKELSIEEKAKRYDEVLRVMESKLKDFQVLLFERKDLEKLFPELKESEDERIRKALIDGFKRYNDGSLFNGCLVREILAWLEKQGEQKPVEWSEEDETVLNNLIYALANDRIGNNRDEYVDWLKSLRPQNRWKPSEEQMECLKGVVDWYHRAGNPAPTLESLYNDLKAMEE